MKRPPLILFEYKYSDTERIGFSYVNFLEVLRSKCCQIIYLRKVVVELGVFRFVVLIIEV